MEDLSKFSSWELKLQFMKLLAFILIFCHAGYFCFDLSDSLFNGVCKNLYNFCHIDFIDGIRRIFSCSHFHFQKFLYTQNIFFKLFQFLNFDLYLFWLFFFICFIWNPTAISNLTFKEFFQLIYRFYFINLFLLKFISVFSFLPYLWLFIKDKSF